MSRPSSRERILDALERILIDSGLHAVTLEAVAERAGVSKGGLLYHFPSKEALITGLAQRLAAQADAEFEQAVTSGDVVDYFIRISVPSTPEGALYWSLLATLRTNEVASPEARRLVVHCFDGWRRLLHEHISDPVTAEIVRLVGDGIYLSALAGLPMPDLALQDQLTARLRVMAQSTAHDGVR